MAEVQAKNQAHADKIIKHRKFNNYFNANYSVQNGKDYGAVAFIDYKMTIDPFRKILFFVDLKIKGLKNIKIKTQDCSTVYNGVRYRYEFTLPNDFNSSKMRTDEFYAEEISKGETPEYDEIERVPFYYNVSDEISLPYAPWTITNIEKEYIFEK